MRTSTALLLALSMTLASCGEGDVKASAVSALQSGDWGKAAADFEKAMNAAEAGSDEYVALAVDRCKALAHTDAEGAKNLLIEIASAHSDKVREKDYSLVASEMVSARNFVPAIHMLDDGIKRYPEAPKLQQLIEKIKVEAEKGGDSETMSALQGLGYVGD